MKGAQFWQRVGNLSVGITTDCDGRRVLVVEGHCPIDNARDVRNLIASMEVCALLPSDDPEMRARIIETGEMHNAMSR